MLKQEIRHYHDSGEYEQEIQQQIDAAQQFLLKKVHYYQTHTPAKKLALVLDIDETSLSNYNKIDRRDFAGNKKEIHQEILAADAPAIEATLRLYQLALKNNVAVFFVTGRSPSEREATERNLLKAGYKNWAALYMRPDEDNKKTAAYYKAVCRKNIESKGYLIIETIGDQDSDLLGGHALKKIKLPNPFYYLP